jgi:hypothetical protein
MFDVRCFPILLRLLRLFAARQIICPPVQPVCAFCAFSWPILPSSLRFLRVFTAKPQLSHRIWALAGVPGVRYSTCLSIFENRADFDFDFER